jgi:hypothetical protein
MRRLLPALFLATALWLVPAASSAAVIQNMSVPLNQTVFNPCTGDFFLASGTIHIVLTQTADASGGFHFDVDVNVSDVTGVGSVTGATYQGVGGFWLAFNADPPFPFTVTATNVFGLISQGPSPNLVVTATFHLTVNADGSVTSSVDRFSLACSG